MLDSGKTTGSVPSSDAVGQALRRGLLKSLKAKVLAIFYDRNCCGRVRTRDDLFGIDFEITARHGA
jgi:hypothetical protein